MWSRGVTLPALTLRAGSEGLPQTPYDPGAP
jgi:hypothetical protein